MPGKLITFFAIGMATGVWTKVLVGWWFSGC